MPMVRKWGNDLSLDRRQCKVSRTPYTEPTLRDVEAFVTVTGALSIQTLSGALVSKFDATESRTMKSTASAIHCEVASVP